MSENRLSSFFKQVVDVKRTTPGRFYLAAAALIFIVLYLSISFGAGKTPGREMQKETSVRAVEDALRSREAGQSKR